VEVSAVLQFTRIPHPDYWRPRDDLLRTANGSETVAVPDDGMRWARIEAIYWRDSGGWWVLARGRPAAPLDVPGDATEARARAAVEAMGLTAIVRRHLR